MDNQFPGTVWKYQIFMDWVNCTTLFVLISVFFFDQHSLLFIFSVEFQVQVYLLYVKKLLSINNQI